MEFNPGGASGLNHAVKLRYEANADTNAFTDAEKTKLAGIAEAATANATDAQLRDRSTHTGTQAASTITGTKTSSFISDFASAVAALITGKQDTLVPGTSIKTVNGTSLLGSGNIAVEGGSGEPGSTPTRVYYFNDFFTFGADNFGNVNQSGTGAAATVVTWPWGGSPVGSGFLNLALGTTATGRATWWATPGSVQLYLGQGEARVRARGGLRTLSNGTDRYIQYIGLANSQSSEPSIGCFFRYSDNLSSGNWQAVTAKSGTTATDTGVAADTNGNHTFEIIVNAAGTSVEFYIDGTLVATNTTNLPNSTDALGILCGARKTLGTTATNASAWDYYSLDMQFPSRT